MSSQIDPRSRSNVVFPTCSEAGIPDASAWPIHPTARKGTGVFLCLTALTLFMALMGVSSVEAQTALPSWLEQCSADAPTAPTNPERYRQVAEETPRCDDPINVQILLTASPFRAARTQPPAVCVPHDQEVTLQRVAEIFQGYAIQYLDTLFEDPFVLLIEALEAEFPCQPSQTSVSSEDSAS